MSDIKPWKGTCHRCGARTSGYKMSWLNQDLICRTCADKEPEHPRYKEAREAELKAVKNGNYNFTYDLL